MVSDTNFIVIKLGNTGTECQLPRDCISVNHLFKNSNKTLEPAFLVGEKVKEVLETVGTKQAQKWLSDMKPNDTALKFLVTQDDMDGRQEKGVTNLKELKKCWSKAKSLRLVPIIQVPINPVDSDSQIDSSYVVEAEFDRSIQEQSWYKEIEVQKFNLVNLDVKRTPQSLNLLNGDAFQATSHNGDNATNPSQGSGGTLSPTQTQGQRTKITLYFINGQQRNANPQWSLEVFTSDTINAILQRCQESFPDRQGSHLWRYGLSHLEYLDPNNTVAQSFPLQPDGISNRAWIADRVIVRWEGETATRSYPVDSTATYVLNDNVPQSNQEQMELWVEWDSGSNKLIGRVLKKNTILMPPDWGQGQRFTLIASPVLADDFTITTSLRTYPDYRLPVQVPSSQKTNDRIQLWRDSISMEKFRYYLCRGIPEFQDKSPEQIAVFSDTYAELGGPIESCGRSLVVALFVQVELSHIYLDEHRPIVRKRKLPIDIPIKTFTPHLLDQGAVLPKNVQMRLRVDKRGAYLDENSTLQNVGIVGAGRQLEFVPTMALRIKDANGNEVAYLEEQDATEKVGEFRRRLEVCREDAKLYYAPESRWLEEGENFLQQFKASDVDANTILEIECLPVNNVLVKWIGTGGEREVPLSPKHNSQELFQQLKNTSWGKSLNDNYALFLDEQPLALPSSSPVVNWLGDETTTTPKLFVREASSVALARSDEPDRQEIIQVRADSLILTWFSAWAEQKFEKDRWQRYQEDFKLSISDLKLTKELMKDLRDYRLPPPQRSNPKKEVLVTYEADIQLNVREAGTGKEHPEAVPIYEKWGEMLSRWDKYSLPPDANEWRIRKKDSRKWLSLNEECGRQDVGSGDTIILQPMTIAYIFDLTHGVMGRMINLTFETVPAPKSRTILEMLVKRLDLDKPTTSYRLAVLDSYTLIRLGDQKLVLDLDEDVFAHGTYEGLLLLGLCEYMEWDTTQEDAPMVGAV